MSNRFRSLVALVAGALAVPVALTTNVTPAAAAPTVPSGFTDTLVSGGLGLAVDVTDLPDGRMLVASQDGQIWVIAADGTKVATPATTRTGLCRANEQGLLGIEVDAAFASNGFVYIFETVGTSSPNCVNRIVRLTMSGNSIAPASASTLIDNIASSAGNHEGGDIQLGKDGNLYISSGDDADLDHPTDLSNLAGKILRIRPDGSIPTGNPFTGANSARCNTGAQAGKECQEIVAYGFRNPFRIAADPNASGTRVFVNDVGLSVAEEIDELLIGGNYGWPTREGFCDTGTRNNCHSNSPGGVRDPIFDYTQSANPGCNAITGGAFVPSGAWPARYSGGYLYGDAGCGRTWVILPDGAGGWVREDFSTGVGPLTSMRTVQQNGVWSIVYTTFLNGGELHRITSNGAGGETQPAMFHPLAPTRVLDTRNGTGYTGRKPAAGDTISVQITGAASGVPSDAVAVALNVTGTESNAAGFVTAWPAGEVRPLASSINFSNANDTVANAVIVRLGVGGGVSLFTQNGAHLVADVTGYWTETVSAQSGRYVPTANPARVLDTRSANGVATTSIVPAGSTIELQVAGRGDVPATGASAVALVVTVANSTTSGFVTVWPTGLGRPLASSVNPVGSGDLRSNLVIVPLGTGGKVSLYTLQPTHLVVDAAGWFTDGTAPSRSTGLMVAVSPRRLIDTRGNNPFGRLNGGDTGLPDFTSAVASGSIAIATNLTVDATSAGGFLTAWPFQDQSRPVASNVNWNGANQTRAALALSKLDSRNQVGYYPNVATDLVLDLSAYFIG